MVSKDLNERIVMNSKKLVEQEMFRGVAPIEGRGIVVDVVQ